MRIDLDSLYPRQIKTRKEYRYYCDLLGVKWIPFLPKYFIRKRLLKRFFNNER